MFLSILLTQVTASCGPFADNDRCPWRQFPMFMTEFGSNVAGSRADFWHEANIYQSLFDHYAFSGAPKDQILQNNLDRLEKYNFHQESNSFMDDRAWLALAAIRAFDLTGNKVFVDHARFVHQVMLSTWNGKCGGGIAWSLKNPYKNTITNGLFFQLSASLYRITKDTTFLTHTETVSNWMASKGLYDGKVFQDGINADNCQIQGGIYTYQLAPLMIGLTELFTATGNSTHLQTAINYAKNSIGAFSTDGVIREFNNCDNSLDTNACGNDGVLFKGIYVRGLGAVMRAAGNLTIIQSSLEKSLQSLNLNPQSIDTNRVRFGLSWSKPSERKDALSQVIALDLFNSLQSTSPPSAACVYSDVNFGGKAICYSQGGYYNAAWNDEISSIQVRQGCTLKADTTGGMQGKLKDFVGSVPWVGNDFNDVISAYTITCI